jgi:ATP/maltotriose-dependent transcriptional regulator MalT
MATRSYNQYCGLAYALDIVGERWTLLINEVTQLSGLSILVLDDYHLITSLQLHETMAFLLDHLPPALHLMLLTRSDPPLPLARLRACRVLNEFRAADLHFSPAETERFLHQNLPVSLPAESMAHLAKRTEGWAAGLRLVTLALAGTFRSGGRVIFGDPGRQPPVDPGVPAGRTAGHGRTGLAG